MNPRTHDIELRTGMTPQFLWNAAGLFFLLPGCLQVASWLFNLTPNPLPIVSVITGGFAAIAVAGVWFELGRRGVSPQPWYHLALMFGLVLLWSSAALDNNDNSADGSYQLLPALLAIVLFSRWQAAPYIVAGVVSSSIFVLLGDDPTPMHRAVMTGFEALSISLILMVGQGQLYAVLRRNRELSDIDELTGAVNTRRLNVQLEMELASARGDDPSPLVLVSIDLDEFKTVNDIFSHTVGDRTLAATASAIQSELSPDDLLARRGGDEFTVMALGRDQRQLRELTLRLGTAIHRARKRICPELESRASIASTQYIPGESVDSLLERADVDLHLQKAERHGRSGSGETRGKTRAPLSAVDSDSNLGPVVGRPLESHESVVRRAAWQMFGFNMGAVAVVVPILGRFGSLDGLRGAGVYATCIVAAGAAVFFLAMSRRTTRDWHLHMAMLVAVGITTALVAVAGDGRNAVVDLFLLPVVISFYAVGGRMAVAYMAGCLVLWTYFLATTSYDALFAVRAIQTALVLTLACVFVPRVVTRARRTAAENERLSGVDPLTSAANVRAMRQRIASEINRSAETGTSVSLLTIDLDNFKLVNDRYSHAVGDRLLKAVAAAIQSQVRENDLVVRRGGDEFVLIVSHIGKIDLDDLAERIDAAIVKERIAICPDISPTASIGRVTSRFGDTIESLLARADQHENTLKRRARDVRHAPSGRIAG